MGIVKHGDSGTRLYRIWCHMKTRCYNPNDNGFKYYGARNITVCDEWKRDFAAFRSWALSHGYTDELTIDRLNPFRGYEPSNCRWVTRTVNSMHEHGKERVGGNQGMTEEEFISLTKSMTEGEQQELLNFINYLLRREEEGYTVTAREAYEMGKAARDRLNK